MNNEDRILITENDSIPEVADKEEDSSDVVTKLKAQIEEEGLRGDLEQQKIRTEEIKGERLKPKQLADLEKQLAKQSKDITESEERNFNRSDEIEAQKERNEQAVNEYAQIQREDLDAKMEEWRTKDKKQEEIYHGQNAQKERLDSQEAELSRRTLIYNEDQKELEERYANLVEREEEVVTKEIWQDNRERQLNDQESYNNEQAASNKKKK